MFCVCLILVGLMAFSGFESYIRVVLSTRFSAIKMCEHWGQCVFNQYRYWGVKHSMLSLFSVSETVCSTVSDRDCNTSIINSINIISSIITQVRLQVLCCIPWTDNQA